MRSASSTMLKRINVLAVLCVGFSTLVSAQTVNSPYSRYGLGDLIPNQNILTRGMGGIGTAYYDYQAINFFNPASYGGLQRVVFDFGVEYDNLSIRTLNPSRKFSNASPIISYINIGLPLKIRKKQIWSVVLGLRPMSRVNYKVLRTERLMSGTLNDSVATLFEGTGGTQQAYLGSGIRFGNFSAGINAGYLFGTKDYSSRRVFLNDTVAYYKANYQTKTNVNGFFFNAGAQYTAKLSSKTWLRFGVQGNWQQEVNASRNKVVETFDYDANDASFQIDSVYAENNVKGKMKMPAAYSAGIILDQLGKWMLGVDYATTKWSQYRLYNEADYVTDSWEMRIGGQIFPTPGKSYWSNVAYRGGFSFGKDYINVDNDLKKWTFSIGAGLPMRRVPYTSQFTIINTALEIGQRGNNSNTLKESFFKVSIGLSMSDLWFFKRKYE